MKNTNEMEIRFDSRSENEGFARVAVASFMTQLNPTVEEVEDVKTAVAEAVQKAADELGSDGRILVRESGTEPLIRVMVEAQSDEICRKYVDSVVKVIESEGLA